MRLTEHRRDWRTASRLPMAMRSMLRFGLATMMMLAAVAVAPTRADAAPTATEVTASSAADIPDFSDLCNWFRPRGYGYVYWIGGQAAGNLIIVYCKVAYSPTECEGYSVVSGDGGDTWARHPDIVPRWCYT